MNQSPFAWRGVVEGFYGVYYTFPERNGLLRCLGDHGFNLYVYGPKNDRQHRNRWREPYPAEIMDQFAETVATARAAGVTFCYALSPGVSMAYSSDEEFATLTTKWRAFYDLGVHAFSLFLDDIAARFAHPADAARYPSYAAAHVDLCRRAFDWLKSLDPANTLTMCPTDYHGRAPFSAYTHELGDGLHADIGVFYTGSEVCAETITAADARAFGEAIQRLPLIWDNYPVNDLAMAPELHLGPVRGRDPALAGAVAGIVANTMNQAEASKVGLLTYAEYLAAPAAYQPDEAWTRALRSLASRDADYAALRLLAEHSLLSCLRAPEAETLQRLAGAALSELEHGAAAGTSGGVRALEAYLIGLDEAVYHLRNRVPNLALRNELLPWLELLEHWAWLGRRALEVLELQARGEPVVRPLAQLRETQDAIRLHPKRLGGQALLPLLELALRRTAEVAA